MGVGDGPPIKVYVVHQRMNELPIKQNIFGDGQGTSLMWGLPCPASALLPPNLIHMNQTGQLCIKIHPSDNDRYRLSSLATERHVPTGALRYALQTEQRATQCSLRHWWQSCSHIASAQGAEKSPQVANKRLQLVDHGYDDPVICIVS